MNVLFDSMGTQVQVQNETWNRMTTWIAGLEKAGYSLSFTDYTKPLSSQLAGQQVLIGTTHHWSLVPNAQCHTPAIPQSVSFSYTPTDLGALQTWVSDGGGLLMFTNHSEPFGAGPNWPIYDIQLAAALGISLVFATFGTSAATMTPAATCPASIANGVEKIFAVDSGGIVPGNGTVLVGLPNVPDSSGLGYNAEDLAFGVLYTLGKGKIIVLGHSGIVGNEGTPYPSKGQIGSGDNETFLNNCVAFLGTP